MRNNNDELAKLRARCIELKTTLERRLKENREPLIRITNLNYHVDCLLQSRKDTALKANLVSAGIPSCDDRHSHNLSGCFIVLRPFSLRQNVDEIIPFCL